MALIVQKYGGTSVGTVERIQGVAQKVKGFRERGHDVVVVVSAMSGETNRLIGMANEISQRPVAARNGCIGFDRRTGHDRASCNGINRTWLCGEKLYRWTSPYSHG